MAYSEKDGQVVLSMSREDFTQLCSAIRAQQVVIHAGQFHQWMKFDICRENPCKEIRALLNRLNQGNPNYTPYQVGEKKS